MGYLEKVFIGSLLLFTLVIVFMFGLYFDVGTMLTSAMKKTDTGSGTAAYSRATDQLERQSVAPEVTVRDSGRPLGGRPMTMTAADAKANFDAVYAQYSRVKPPPTLEGQMEFRRKQLAEQGYGAEFIEMEVRSMDERELEETLAKVNDLVKNGQIEVAADLLNDQIEALDKRDLITAQRYRMRLQQLYFEANEFEKYQKTMLQIFDTEDRILGIQAASKMAEDKQSAEVIKKRREDLNKKRGEFGSYYDEVTKVARENGGKFKVTEAHVSELKAALLREQQAGRISADDLQEALVELEKAAEGKTED